MLLPIKVMAGIDVQDMFDDYDSGVGQINPGLVPPTQVEPEPKAPLNPVVAAVLYEEIARYEDGLYVWVDPSEASILTLTQLLKTAPFKTKDCTEMHATVLHCSGVLPKSIEVDDKPQYGAVATKFEMWIDHKQRAIVVLSMNSPDLEKAHKQFTAQGLEHGYHEYNPHMTVGKNVETGPGLDQWLASMNAMLELTKPKLIFDQLKAATCA